MRQAAMRCERAKQPISTVPTKQSKPATPAFRWPTMSLTRRAAEQDERLIGGAGADKVSPKRRVPEHPIIAQRRRAELARRERGGIDRDTEKFKTSTSRHPILASRELAMKATEEPTEEELTRYPAQEHPLGTPPPDYPAKDHRAHRAASAAMPGRTIVEPEPIPQEERKRLLEDWKLFFSGYPVVDDELYRIIQDLENVREMTTGQKNQWRRRVIEFTKKGKGQKFWGTMILNKAERVQLDPFEYPRALSNEELGIYTKQATNEARSFGAAKRATDIAGALSFGKEGQLPNVPGASSEFASEMMATGERSHLGRIDKYQRELARREALARERQRRERLRLPPR